MGSRAGQDVFDSLRQRGWARCYERTRSGFLSLARALGRVRKLPGGDEVEELRVRETGEVAKRSLSSIYGTSAFPLHTDYAHNPTPPRFVLLRNPLEEKIRGTTLAPPGAYSIPPSAQRTLRRRALIVRGGPGPFYAPILFGDDGDFVRWDRDCMTPDPLSSDANGIWVECLSRASAYQTCCSCRTSARKSVL